MKKQERHLAAVIARVLSGFCLCGSAVTAIAATYSVPGNYSTISAAITAVPDGSIILVSPGTYTSFIDARDLKKTIYIKATGGVSNTFISGSGANRFLWAENSANGNPDKNLTFDGFTFTQGRGGSGLSPITIANAKTAFLNCRFVNNSSPALGGVASIYTTAGHAGAETHPLFLNCLFQDNWSDGFGGAVLVNGLQAQADFKNCIFRNNSNRSAGANYQIEGGALEYADASGIVDSCLFDGNSTYYAGGAIMLLTWWDSPSSRVVIRNSRFINNFCQEDGARPIAPPTEGGAIMAEANFDVEVIGCVFSNNWAEAGGGIHSFRANLDIRQSVFEDCDAVGQGGLGYGGAIGMRIDDTGDSDRRDATLEVEDVMIRNCSGPSAGAIYSAGDIGYSHLSSVTLGNVVVDSCEATGSNVNNGHGGAFFFDMADVDATDVFLLNNHANRGGGAITLIRNTSLAMNDSYIVNNTASLIADNDHDGIYNPDFLPLNLGNTVLAYNGGSPTVNTAVFTACPRVTVGERANMAYFVSPFNPGVDIQPGVGAVPNDGGFTAGAAVAEQAFDASRNDGSISYAMTSSYPTQRSRVAYSCKGLTNTPFKNTSPVLPARIEAEDFDRGGEVSAYRDTSTANEGGQYRLSESVDIAADSGASGGYCVGWLNTAEWTEYVFTVQTAGVFNLSVRAAAPAAGGMLYVQVDDSDKTGLLNIPSTGGWGTYQSVTKQNVSLRAGLHIMRCVIVSGGFNLDYLEWTVAPNDPLLSTSVNSLTKTVKEGKAGTSTFQVWNSGVGVLSYLITNDSPWMTISPTNGSSADEKDTITVHFDTTRLSTGTYQGVIVVSSGDATNSPKTIPVTFKIVPDYGTKNDFDGDGQTDIGIFRPSAVTWYVFQSSAGPMPAFQFGTLGDLPVPADYDGDGFSDLAVFRPSTVTWYVFGSSAGPMSPFQFGTVGDMPAPADYDGDGIDDLAIYRPSTMTWYVFGSDVGPVDPFVFGAPGDIPVPADYDGDGRADLAIFRPSTVTWYVFGSKVGPMSPFQFGTLGDLPAPGDYDADGRIDMAIFRPSTVTWYIFGTSAGPMPPFQFGTFGDLPIR